ncbi:serine/threonine protein kinase [Nocardioides baekrokdamisoli]|uniref:non-specific serine/threonine protein kinase n=1 Tax=Nocardioides baekrokdamisoli TaxID=1804624 RepID=A0A3G9J1K5_9ACTN|nr:serine/threonine-protein kinase [Nocardioides baekrokdamisoli]BBH17354.1 serine/threonine protein kinase [Nocardioides baekrokdamisoli]
MAGRYVFGDFIASGGMAEVWRARDNDYSRDVAIKLLKPEYADDPASRARFDAEARHVQSIDHPNVAAVYDVGEMPTASGLIRPYLTMEYVAGRPLSAIIGDGPLAPELVQSLLAQAGDGLAAAHGSGIVHRDVKPANLLVTDSGTLKITDFGIARSASQGAVTVTGQVVGTPQYLSPEQARGEVATPASDVYGLGVVAFEALTGSRPFDRPTAVATALAHLEDPVPALPDTVPAGLAAVVERSLAKDPADRYATGAEFADAMRAAKLTSASSVPVDNAEPTVVVAPVVRGGHEDVPTQAIAAIDVPIPMTPVADAAPTDFVPATQAPLAQPIDPLAPQRSNAKPAVEPEARADGPTHSRTTVVRLPKSVKPLASAVNKKTSAWPFGTLDTVLVVLGALTILALGWVAYFLNSGAPTSPTTPTPTATQTSHPTKTSSAAPTPPALVNMTCGPVTADGKYLKGRQLSDVESILTGLGVKVQANAEKGTPINTVSRVTPCRGVHVGDTVQIYYWSDLATSSSSPTSGATP